MVNNHPDMRPGTTCRSGRICGSFDHESQSAHPDLGHCASACRRPPSRPTMSRRSSSTSRSRRCRSRSAPAGTCAATSATISRSMDDGDFDLPHLRSDDRDLQPRRLRYGVARRRGHLERRLRLQFHRHDPRRLHGRRLPREFRRHDVERCALRRRVPGLCRDGLPLRGQCRRGGDQLHGQWLCRSRHLCRLHALCRRRPRLHLCRLGLALGDQLLRRGAATCPRQACWPPDRA